MFLTGVLKSVVYKDLLSDTWVGGAVSEAVEDFYRWHSLALVISFH